ncbi:uncharacterized protein LOC132276119 [Cornus florida]|uniref:uncharacterized protein LOC132276119 n=1 Tax=Cornus florida TaxID=4283 RepID=UPI002899575E|nr:uncharacterized protein LOC132276119 [Cornus florida]
MILQVAQGDDESFCRPSSSEQTPPRRRHSDLFESLESLKVDSSPQRKVSPAMSTLQGYYGLKATDKKAASEGCEMAVYWKGGSQYLEDELLAKPFPSSHPPLGHHGKSKSVSNGFLSENGELANGMSVAETRDGDSDRWNEKLVRRRQKSEADFASRTPEMLLKEDNSNGGGFSAITGKGLALRPKSASRTSSGVDAEAGWLNPIPVGLGDSLLADSFVVVRKSSSTPSLQDQDSNTTSSVWQTQKWCLKPEIQTAIARPIFDGLPKPITGRRNKAALD